MCAGLRVCVCKPQDNLRCHPQECHPLPWDMVSSLAWRLLTMTDHLSCKQLSFSASSLLELQVHTFMPSILIWILAISDSGPMFEEQELELLPHPFKILLELLPHPFKKIMWVWVCACTHARSDMWHEEVREQFVRVISLLCILVLKFRWSDLVVEASSSTKPGGGVWERVSQCNKP